MGVAAPQAPVGADLLISLATGTNLLVNCYLEIKPPAPPQYAQQLNIKMIYIIHADHTFDFKVYNTYYVLYYVFKI